MPDLDLDLHARENARLAELINSIASGNLPAPPPEIPSEAVANPTIHEAAFEPAPSYVMPWQTRVLAAERHVDLNAARGELRAALIDRAVAVDALAAVADELARSDALVAEIEAAQAAHAEQGNRQIANLADRLREWVAAGSPGERPACGSVPHAPAPRDHAELMAARMARADVASDHDRARAAHALAVQAVDRARCQVLVGEGQRIAERYEAALAAMAELQTAAGALLGLTISGSPAVSGLIRERLPGAAAPTAGDNTAARWASYAAALADDPDAQLL